jgi:hypothetical protein
MNWTLWTIGTDNLNSKLFYYSTVLSLTYLLVFFLFYMKSRVFIAVESNRITMLTKVFVDCQHVIQRRFDFTES